jgi:hypothetical protein
MIAVSTPAATRDDPDPVDASAVRRQAEHDGSPVDADARRHHRESDLTIFLGRHRRPPSMPVTLSVTEAAAFPMGRGTRNERDPRLRLEGELAA